MTNKSLMIINHCVPCGCACRHCFFCSRKAAPHGVPYEAGERLALRFAQHGMPVSYAISHCADYPELTRNIALNRKLGFAGAPFLQINGIALRDQAALHEYLSQVQHAGVTTIDTTFYGTEAYHDNFAVRKGDFAFLCEIITTGLSLGLAMQPTFLATQENATQLSELIDTLTSLGCTSIYGFIQDYKGNGETLEDMRLDQAAYNNLPETVKQHLGVKHHKTQAQWLAAGEFAPPTERHLRLALRADNIAMLETMTCDDIIGYLAGLDDAYHAALPTLPALATRYGDRGCPKLYRQRDLQWKWQKAHIKAQNLALHDVTDERNCGAIWR
ncbi:MAG: hypothetical protein FWB76_07510 [Oscillospiraceae bacterium]|nr:hypothetical protein [Oscillospiraceae bacterium]